MSNSTIVFIVAVAVVVLAAYYGYTGGYFSETEIGTVIQPAPETAQK